MKLRFKKLHYMMADMIRHDGIERTPEEVKKVLYVFRCSKCGLVGMNCYILKDQLTRTTGEVQCNICGQMHKVNYDSALPPEKWRTDATSP